MGGRGDKERDEHVVVLQHTVLVVVNCGGIEDTGMIKCGSRLLWSGMWRRWVVSGIKTSRTRTRMRTNIHSIFSFPLRYSEAGRLWGVEEAGRRDDHAGGDGHAVWDAVRRRTFI